MARRAARALTAVLAFGVLAPAALLIGSTGQSAAASADANQPPATVAFTGLSPQWASPAATISVSGTVKNTAPVTERLAVQLLDSRTPLRSVAELEQGASGALYGLAGLPLPGATWTSGLLRPGASASWLIQVPVSAMGFTSFGVYPMAAQIYDARGNPLNNTLTFVPYVPAKNGIYGSSVPAAQKVSWVWPLIDQPLLDAPWQSACAGTQAAALAQSLGSSGRLGQLVDAAGATTTTAVVQAQAAQAGAVTPAAQHQATLTDPGQSLAQDDAVTWVVDPALLANVTALAQCGSSEPQWARTAAAWLARFKADTASQPVIVTAYGDPNVTALIGAGYDGDVGNSYTYGRSQASQILGKNLTPPDSSSSPASAAGVAWSTGGPISYTAAESLAGKDDISTLLADGSAFPLQQTSVLRTPDGVGTYLNVLLANDSLTSLLGSAGTGPGSAFTAAQQFLAETALLAEQNPSSPIIVAPPRRWQPPAGLAAKLLTATASAPWLSPATLTSLTGAATAPTVQLPSSAPGLSPLEQDQLTALDAGVARQQALRAAPDPSLFVAVSTIESSAFAGRFKESALGMITMVADQLAGQEQKVHIIAENRITLGGTKGSVPVSIDNRLPFAVRVALQVSYSQADGMQISASPGGLSTVPPHTAETVRLRISAAQTGSTTVTMTLLNQADQPLASAPVRTTVQTTQVGLLGMIIFGAALGVFLLASAARAIRRGKPRPAPAEAGPPDPGGADHTGQSAEEPGPDTVITGHRELGPAGSSRPR